MIPIKRKPTTPGEILNEEFLKPMGLTQKQLADRFGCDVKVINRIINGRTSVTAEMAVRLCPSTLLLPMSLLAHMTKLFAKYEPRPQKVRTEFVLRHNWWRRWESNPRPKAIRR